jgi:hypothetical protein
MKRQWTTVAKATLMVMMQSMVCVPVRIRIRTTRSMRCVIMVLLTSFPLTPLHLLQVLQRLSVLLVLLVLPLLQLLRDASFRMPIILTVYCRLDVFY